MHSTILSSTTTIPSLHQFNYSGPYRMCVPWDMVAYVLSWYEQHISSHLYPTQKSLEFYKNHIRQFVLSAYLAYSSIPNSCHYLHTSFILHKKNPSHLIPFSVSTVYIALIVSTFCCPCACIGGKQHRYTAELASVGS